MTELLINNNGKDNVSLEHLNCEIDSDEQILNPDELTDLVAQAVLDKLEERKHHEVFLDGVIDRVQTWKFEIDGDDFILPIVNNVIQSEPNNFLNQDDKKEEIKSTRKSLYYKYEGDYFSNLRTRLLVSCLNNDSGEGGFFELDFAKNTLKKIVKCDGRGMIKYNGGYLLASRDRGMFVLDSELHVVKNYPLEGLDLHGVACGPNGLVYIVETTHNRIGIYNMDPFQRMDEIVISSDLDDRNHVNDLCFRDGRLLVSMFSTKEYWRENLKNMIFDGAVLEFDINEKKSIRTIASGLQMPHTLKLVGGELCYCESFGLNVVQSGVKIALYSGYTRGLEFDGRFFYVGQSRLRHRSRHKELTLSNDAGVHILAPQEHISRFIQLPTSEVYGILVIE